MKFLKGFVYAANGLWLVIRTQRNMRIHILIALLVICAGYYLNITNTEYLFILLLIALVLSAEVFNTAIEKMVDLQSPDFNKKAGEIKDISAAAVLITAIIAFVSGIFIFVPYLIN